MISTPLLQPPTPFSFTFLGLRQFSPWRMLRNALSQARHVQSDREIEHYLESTGGKLTDEGEREIMRRLMSSSNSSRW
jgi:hypothetical protein